MTQLLPSEVPVPNGASVEFLRRSTQAAHERLEAGLAIAGPRPSDDDVLAYFAALYGWLAPVERALWSAAWPGAMAAAMRAAKLGWLADDLRAAGVDTEVLPRCGEPQPVASVAARYGLAYVVEGSTLGGRVLARQLAAAGSRYANSRFLAGYGDETGAAWRTFRDLLELDVHTAADLADAAGAAVQAFATLQRWLSRQDVFRA